MCVNIGIFIAIYIILYAQYYYELNVNTVTILKKDNKFGITLYYPVTAYLKTPGLVKLHISCICCLLWLFC